MEKNIPSTVIITVHNDFETQHVVVKWFFKTVNVILGLNAIWLGILTIIDTSLRCILAGIFLSFSGVMVLVFELPILCNFLELMKPLTQFSQSWSSVHKLIFYLVPPIIVIAACQSISAIVGSICLFGVAAIYLYLAFSNSRTSK
ncbi:unnamed protein product [Brachionus calyciflorus]|uniref:Calcium channel flower n=1 Tax=Brachionus calyciflorus TaxID=104777 RepID=A0A813RTC0_9BILA|nr:unnamed protein product [Brachionus calyciflorus]